MELIGWLCSPLAQIVPDVIEQELNVCFGLSNRVTNRLFDDLRDFRKVS
jgi:hypothetical protein